MNTLKTIFRTLFQLLKEVCFLPHTIANALKARRERTDLAAREAERLDRIRCPSKYIGK